MKYQCTQYCSMGAKSFPSRCATWALTHWNKTTLSCTQGRNISARSIREHRKTKSRAQAVNKVECHLSNFTCKIWKRNLNLINLDQALPTFFRFYADFWKTPEEIHSTCWAPAHLTNTIIVQTHLRFTQRSSDPDCLYHRDSKYIYTSIYRDTRVNGNPKCIGYLDKTAQCLNFKIKQLSIGNVIAVVGRWCSRLWGQRLADIERGD